MGGGGGGVRVSYVRRGVCVGGGGGGVRVSYVRRGVCVGVVVGVGVGCVCPM